MATQTITTRTINSLKPKTKDYVVRDELQSGFQIKVTPTGAAIYQVEARLGGTGRVKKFKIANVQDVSLEEARESARLALKKIRAGIDPLQEKRAAIHEGKTLRQLIDFYFQTKNLKPRTLRDYTIFKEQKFYQWLDKRVSDLTKHEIRDWYVAGRATPTRTEHAYRFLNALMVFAKGLEIIETNPCELVTNAGMRYKLKTRTTHLDVNHDLPKFLTALAQFKPRRDSERVAIDMIVLILATGLRSNEAKTLKWADVDLERKQFIIRDPKNGREHIVPLIPLTYSMFKARKADDDGSDYIFRIKGGLTKSPFVTDIQKTLSNICKSGGMTTTVTPHDLRRTFATALNSFDVGYADLKTLMNHAQKDITAGVYIRPDIEKLRRILFKLVDFYDQKIPFFEPRQGVSRYATGTLRFSIYGVGQPQPTELDNPMADDDAWLAHAEAELWDN